MAAYRADEVDVHIARRLRIRREMLRIGIVRLAAEVGISKTQVTQYELGQSKMSGSMIHRFAVALRVPHQYFFDGLPDVPEIAPEDDPMRRQDLLEILHKFSAADQELKTLIAAVVKRMT